MICMDGFKFGHFYSLKGKGAYSEKLPRTPLHNTIYGSK